MDSAEPQAKKKKDTRVTLEEPTRHNRESIRLLTTTLLPVRYGPSFYDNVLKTPDLTRLAYFNDIFVGAICARYEKEGEKHRVYIMTLGVLAPYRRFGIASQLLDHVMGIAEKGRIAVDEVYLHAWVANEDGIAFYKKHNFTENESLPGYYKTLTPPDAIRMSRKITPSK